MKVEISFDDNHISDIKASRLMEQYGFRGTFYNTNTPVRGTIQMTPMEIKREILDRGHEIGGHTISHPTDMKLMPDEQLKFELENVYNGVPMTYGYWRGEFKQGRVNKFCYPRGRHDERVRKAVEKAGYLEARTTRVLQIRNDTGDPFQTPTTIHMYPRAEYEGKDWRDLAVELFDQALELWKAGDDRVFFSLWGHTKEMDEYQYWGRFEYLLGYMRKKLDEGKGEPVPLF